MPFIPGQILVRAYTGFYKGSNARLSVDYFLHLSMLSSLLSSSLLFFLTYIICPNHKTLCLVINLFLGLFIWVLPLSIFRMVPVILIRHNPGSSIDEISAAEKDFEKFSHPPNPLFLFISFNLFVHIHNQFFKVSVIFLFSNHFDSFFLGCCIPFIILFIFFTICMGHFSMSITSERASRAFCSTLCSNSKTNSRPKGPRLRLGDLWVVDDKQYSPAVFESRLEPEIRHEFYDVFDILDIFNQTTAQDCGTH